MDPLRRFKQLGLLIVLAFFLGSIWILTRKVMGASPFSWPIIIVVIIGLVTVSAAILYAIFQSSYLPTPDQVQQVVREIHQAYARGIKSSKADLHFYFPPHWRTYKVGKEGWVLRPKGLGIPVSISIWATDQVPEFSDNSLPGMLRNIQELTEREGGKVIRDSVQARRIAGVEGIEYVVVDSKDHKMFGFFWCYKGGDYQILIDASNLACFSHLSKRMER